MTALVAGKGGSGEKPDGRFRVRSYTYSRPGRLRFRFDATVLTGLQRAPVTADADHESQSARTKSAQTRMEREPSGVKGFGAAVGPVKATLAGRRLLGEATRRRQA